MIYPNPIKRRHEKAECLVRIQSLHFPLPWHLILRDGRGGRVGCPKNFASINQNLILARNKTKLKENSLTVDVLKKKTTVNRLHFLSISQK